jgi:hypothetical protein
MIALAEWLLLAGLASFAVLLIVIWVELDPDKEKGK